MTAVRGEKAGWAKARSAVPTGCGGGGHASLCYAFRAIIACPSLDLCHLTSVI